MQIIDAQIHLWAGDSAPPHHWRAPYTVERALRDMDQAGVDRAVNCPAIWDAGANDYAVEAAQSHPERFATLGWFSLDDSADESLVDRWLAKPGMLGLRFVLVMPDIADRLASRALDWLWAAADRREIPVALMVLPQQLPAVADIAARFPRMRLLMDHLAISPFERLPGAAAHFEALLALARQPNIAIKATAVPSMATDEYPFASTHGLLRQAFNAFGAERTFWGTDITRLHCTWHECVTMFVDDLPWLRGRDLELVMGRAVANWIGWP
ncbi:amidohydrolase family protein [Frankia sp. CNm7]|uniref:Amidohydrolase family protein n=1 Tax=Frankia nepalensis TaxID=1836974 RepID=A0A937RV70_9ACTN|nr:amidohydrolase family protein [Frankia nepalensis]MBL7501975.1 amidohydrolase family protein [Frankia nepalensis]MBL7510605.1 amidohydrolase family protein [Frankia nepalensis]MBL7517345.1 amidohydrolase family protein [Frankia nepalensis]MBL7633428.1 amidohydrolase family protein [Frankia nepalensis]